MELAERLEDTTNERDELLVQLERALAVTPAEFAMVLASRRRTASMGRGTASKNGLLAADRPVSANEGVAFERHTGTCAGCEYCRPSRGAK